MKRILAIVAFVAAAIFTILGFSRLNDDKKILDIGVLELKNENASPSVLTQNSFIIAGICLAAGIVLSYQNK